MECYLEEELLAASVHPVAAEATSAFPNGLHPPPADHFWATSSFVLQDCSILRYRMEGNAFSESPVLLFINDAFTNFRIWEPTIALFKELRPQYRLLRYGESSFEPL